jgi:glyoxylase-like metal-dependent hydrolase (beta-lactamase superfamily II)
MKGLILGDFEIFWLNGGEFELDGGTMFGVVPKTLWLKKYATDGYKNVSHDNNYIKLLNAPLLVKTPDALVLIETGLGNKLNGKQKEVFRVKKEWDLPGDLKKMGLKRQDVNYVILTHCDFDHAGGIVMHNADDDSELTFPNAKHIVQEAEWQDAMHPNIRSANTYWPENFSELKDADNLQLVNGNFQVCEGIEVQQTGGHTKGHQIVRMESRGKVAYHLADLLPTHVHYNPLWIMAYDNFPMDAISLKEKYEALALEEDAWLTYYHDPFMFASKFDSDGKVVKKFTLKAPGKPKPKRDIHIQDINVRKDNRVAIGCPKCAQVRDLSVEKYMGRKHFLTLNCTCGATFGVNLDFRQNYRKAVSIGGYYSTDEAGIGSDESGKIPTVPVNCRIQNISMGGLGFTTLDQMRAQVGDRLMVKFTLDREPPEIIEKEVIVKTIQDNYIGCEFIEESGFTDRTLGFYLMK